MKDRINSVVSCFYIEQGLPELFDGITVFDEAVDRAVDKAYSDACRPLTGIGRHEEQKNSALNNLKRFIKEKRINEKHEEYCRKWTESKLDEKHKTYGTAQKIVNMSMKYLYCWARVCDGWRTIDHDSFSDCHMPIDRYTLIWLIDQDQNRGKKEDYLAGINKTTAWSCLSYSEYKRIVDFIKELYRTSDLWKLHGDLYGLTILESEFVIWEYQKVRSIITPAVESLSKYSDYMPNTMIGKLSKGVEGISEVGTNISLKSFLD